MIDKELIKNKFQKSLNTYPEHALLQPNIAHKLAEFIDKDYEDILEIGSYSGFLTREIVKKTEFRNYTALDIVDSFDCIKNLSPKIKFILADIEEVELNQKYDLIISSSSLQWCNNLAKTTEKLKANLKPNGRIMLAIFGKKNRAFSF